MLQGLIETNFKVDPQSWDIQYKVFEGKQDLEKYLSRVPAPVTRAAGCSS